jgi:sugar-specific transcriptional regulator TrmB
MIEELKEYELDKYESLVYVALLKIGLSTSSVISKKSGVPYGRIYSVLFSLESKGFIKIYQGMPKRFMAIEPRIVLNKIIDEKMKEITYSKEKTDKIIQELEKIKKGKLEKPLEKIQIIEGKKNYLNLSVKLHEGAKEEWRTIHGLPLYEPHLEAYKKAIKRGIKTRILTCLTEKNIKNLEIWKKTGAEIRHLDNIFAHFTIIDNDKVVIRLSDEYIGGYVSLFIQSPALAKTLVDNFDNLWKSAKVV